MRNVLINAMSALLPATLHNFSSVELSVESTVFNASISEGLFPNNWEFAKVGPICKEGPTKDR